MPTITITLDIPASSKFGEHLTAGGTVALERVFVQGRVTNEGTVLHFHELRDDVAAEKVSVEL